MRTVLFAVAAAVICLLSAAGCGDDDAPAGDPYVCGATMCREGQACIENDGARDGTWACARDVGCTMGVDVNAAYCPEATGSVFCMEDQPFTLSVPMDGSSSVMQSKVLCQY